MFAAMAAVMVPTMATTFSRMQQFAVEHPDQATVTSGPGTYSIQIHGNHPELLPDMTRFFAPLGIGVVVAVVLLAAAVTRRLHDRGRRGYWGLMPLPFLAFGLTVFPKMFATMSQGDVSPETLGLFFTLFFNNMLYLASLGLLIFLLAARSDVGSNRFGPPEA
jgi:uncharacterized membrane protein YhaH (DUF805 family)